MHNATSTQSGSHKLSAWVLLALLVLASGYVVVMMYSVGEHLIAGILCALLALSSWVYTSSRLMAMRFLWPGVIAALIFVVLPMVYTIQMGFTNKSTRNLLDEHRVRDYLLSQSDVMPNSEHGFSLHRSGEQWRLKLSSTDERSYVTDAINLGTQANATAQTIELTPFTSDMTLGDAAPMRDVIAHLDALKALTLKTPSGLQLKLSTLRQFAAMSPVYILKQGNELHHQVTGAVYKPKLASGFYESAKGEALLPGFTAAIGMANYTRIFTDPKFNEPFFRIFVWTVLFAALSVLLAASLGMVIAVLLNWEALRYKQAYRLILFLPYAVPGFISILVFKGLFNQNLGEVNLILNGLFGVKPAWFTDPFLAKVMLLIVNTWLGFPYMMLLCSGLIKAIPADLYEASAIAGAGPITNFFKITLPLIFKPLTPLLIAAFAFNFNNFVLISLLTKGRPDYLDMSVPAGTTDILVSYTWRIAFQESGQQFGLAAAISTVIFLLVAAVTLVQMRLTHLAEEGKS
jgi:maltose/maltodextrin transport system permease protein